MKKFVSGINNFFVGLVSGLLLPIIIILFLLFLSVDKITALVESKSFIPLYAHGEQTLDKVDKLISTLDDKVEQADLNNMKALTSLKASIKDVQLLPEFKLLTSTLLTLNNVKGNSEKQKSIEDLKVQLQSTLKDKFSGEQSQQLVNNFINIAEIIAAKNTQDNQISSEMLKKISPTTE